MLSTCSLATIEVVPNIQSVPSNSVTVTLEILSKLHVYLVRPYQFDYMFSDWKGPGRQAPKKQNKKKVNIIKTK